MGWSFSILNTGRKAHIESLTSAKHFSNGYIPITHRVVGNHVWQLVQRPDGTKFITLDLIAKERGGGWGHKGLDEDWGLYHYGCPTTLLDKADPPATENAKAWRIKVWEYADRQKRLKREMQTLKPGTVIVTAQNQYTLLEDLGRSGWRVNDQYGAYWRLTKRFIKSQLKV
jgi:hypothetical protein